MPIFQMRFCPETVLSIDLLSRYLFVHIHIGPSIFVQITICPDTYLSIYLYSDAPTCPDTHCPDVTIVQIPFRRGICSSTCPSVQMTLRPIRQERLLKMLEPSDADFNKNFRYGLLFQNYYLTFAPCPPAKVSSYPKKILFIFEDSS